MRSVDPREHPVPFVHRLLLSGVAPRPIAFVASTDSDGNVNLSPFSFFNAFGANPPVIVVSPAYRGKDGTSKHTFENITTTGEFTVSAVSYAMVEQMSLASSDYERGVNEFVKAGFTPAASSVVAAPYVKESPFAMECRLMQHIGTGGKPGSGNLLMAEVLKFHVRDDVFDGEHIDPHRLDLVARMGGNWYVRANGDALFELSKPRHNGIGMDALPAHIRESSELTGNHLAKLAGVATMPLVETVEADQLNVPAAEHQPGDSTPLPVHNVPQEALDLLRDHAAGRTDEASTLKSLFHLVRHYLERNDVQAAWQCALLAAPGRLGHATHS